MHKTLTAAATVALLGAASAAYAADIYTPGYKDAAPAAYPTWTGYYIGGHVGGVWSTIDFTDVTSVPNVPFNNDTSAFFGGGQAGFNYQLGNLVIGPEVDVGGMGLSHTVTEVNGLGAVGSVTSGFYFDITGRLGYTWGPALVYIKGGYAYYGGSLSVNDGFVLRQPQRPQRMDGWRRHRIRGQPRLEPQGRIPIFRIQYLSAYSRGRQYLR